jgi:SAM-dependent methyltransferase
VLLAVAKKRYQVTGFDLQERAIRTARSRYSLGDVHVATLDQFFDYWQSSQQQHYDVVTLFDVLEHLEDPRSSVGVLSQMLRPGGWLVLTLPNRRRWPDFYKDADRPPNHLTRWDRRSMTDFLFVNGFTVVKLKEFNEYGLVSLRVLSRILSHVLKPVGAPAAGEPGTDDARSGVIRKSMWDSVAGWMWYACVRTAVVLDAPIYAFLRLIGAPRQMLYCVARRVEGIDRVRT